MIEILGSVAQGGHFDVADRLFNSVADAWRGVTTSMSDVKELVPEFYYTPDFLINRSRLDMGVRQAGAEPVGARPRVWSVRLGFDLAFACVRNWFLARFCELMFGSVVALRCRFRVSCDNASWVHGRGTGTLVLFMSSPGLVPGDVALPPWAHSPADFIAWNRRALECEHVSSRLHEWVDLIFGHKQRGAAAVSAANVFYYLTYEGLVSWARLHARSPESVPACPLHVNAVSH